jgi:hypothetical protein
VWVVDKEQEIGGIMREIEIEIEMKSNKLLAENLNKKSELCSGHEESSFM